ncbi:OSCP, subunit 5 of the stator stalk of mitochondrial F1F0 ATP synthase [Laetiporus sulphureus 93-53]|uniref:ATP synthase subunit 5, mitochondrial n=1 Tax=Laetiporus sulphureus 93-53 TaxID=1314785 RepID=A0A165GZN2_9APHY|nr:OSCP, subunit 5 of the stator stalk of mitochondrial F1F0 ATP synthase [Laetiporus sulphureus 93-53]KZT11048.1 OSCP, subunit 5 of the stator stalk of mitochondrial F1F0 ATP synthase [Laetiporus sulphureus 93-53]
MLLSSARTAALSVGLGRRSVSAIASKYSSAIFKAALVKPAPTLNKVENELRTISSLINTDPKLATFITNPTLSARDRLAGLAGLFTAAEGTGAKKEPVSEITKNLFIVLSENGRLAEAQGVIEGFNELLSKHNGELTVTITSAAPLAKDVQTRLESVLRQSQAAKQAKTVKVANKINPAILGGVVVDFGDKTIDLSVISRVTRLNSLLQQSV